jgi:sterol desaturase/sphingolipid hydroxylase (fatty acid hydroxylase superfamily)
MYAATATLLALVAVLDLWDLRRSAREGHSTPTHERLGWPAWLFLAGVVVVFLAVEMSGNWLMPHPLRILAATRSIATSWLGATPAGPPPLAASLVMGVLLFYVAGFYDYALHRWFSHNRWFWFTHEYHHLPRVVSVWIPGILGKPFAFVPGVLATLATAGTFYLALALFRLPAWDLEQLVPVALVVIVVLTTSHSSFLRRIPAVHGTLKWLCVTSPQEHVLHHAAHLRGNFGNFTTVWDRLFGTYLDPCTRDTLEIPLGLPYDQDFLGTLTGGRCKLSAKIRERFQIARICHLEEHQGAL